MYVETNNPQIHALCHARSVYKDKEKKNLHDIECKLIFQTLGYLGLHRFLQNRIKKGFLILINLSCAISFSPVDN